MGTDFHNISLLQSSPIGHAMHHGCPLLLHISSLIATGLLWAFYIELLDKCPVFVLQIDLQNWGPAVAKWGTPNCSWSARLYSGQKSGKFSARKLIAFFEAWCFVRGNGPPFTMLHWSSWHALRHGNIAFQFSHEHDVAGAFNHWSRFDDEDAVHETQAKARTEGAHLQIQERQHSGSD